MARARVLLNESELRDYSKEHVLYEIAMLAGCAQLLACPLSAPSEALAGVLRNILIESFGLHLRNLIDFLYPSTNIKPTDVLADDYFDDGIRPDSFPVLPPSLHEARKRAHKELSHLTSERLAADDPRKSWPFSSLTCDLFDVLEWFARTVSAARLAPEVFEFVKNVRKLQARDCSAPV